MPARSPKPSKPARKSGAQASSGDNLGLRNVLPMLLLQSGLVDAAKRACKSVADEPWLNPAAIRAFVAFALGNIPVFRRKLVDALITLPWLRLFLLNQTKPLPDADEGFRHVYINTATFSQFTWDAYLAVPGLRKACVAMLAEPAVLAAEAELRKYWQGFQRRDGHQLGSLEGWQALCEQARDRMLGGAV